jgi:hypothetical protein
VREVGLSAQEVADQWGPGVSGTELHGMGRRGDWGNGPAREERAQAPEILFSFFFPSNSCSVSILNLNPIPLSGFNFQIPLLKYKPNVKIYSTVYNIIIYSIPCYLFME